MKQRSNMVQHGPTHPLLLNAATKSHNANVFRPDLAILCDFEKCPHRLFCLQGSENEKERKQSCSWIKFCTCGILWGWFYRDSTANNRSLSREFLSSLKILRTELPMPPVMLSRCHLVHWDSRNPHLCFKPEQKDLHVRPCSILDDCVSQASGRVTST